MKHSVDKHAGDSVSSSLLPFLGELDLHLIGEGRHERLADCLGAHVVERDGVRGVRFAVWAPNAMQVSVVGDFNTWDGTRNPMSLHSGAGVWETFVPGVTAGSLYKFELLDRYGGKLPLKADPLARLTERPPGDASVVGSPDEFVWTDFDWVAERPARQSSNAPLLIYEVHMGSWLRPAHEGSVWDHVGPKLIDYAVAMQFTHIELLPITEHPFGGSWGYQPLGMFAPTARWGSPKEFARFVDRCHAAGLGLILDWVPAHFPSDAYGLARFDGTALYEHEDKRQGWHPDWDTLIYNFGRNEVRNFLVASAREWIERFHVDGLRVDAVASMLYLDYSRQQGQWIPNKHGGRENLDAKEFIQQLNAAVTNDYSGVIMIAEESTAWAGVTAPVNVDGLGFHYKWNMGWMNDTLRYMRRDPIHRRYGHNDFTFGLVYAWTEKFILALSHDEVVHGKGSLLQKMPGDRWQQFANLRAYFGFMWAHPGKKLIFMGGEFAQAHEWNHEAQLDWEALADPAHGGVKNLVQDLNGLYKRTRALYASDDSPEGFEWLIGDDSGNSVFAFLRHCSNESLLVICNMTPVPRQGYRVGVPCGGIWAEKLNTDSSSYGGSNMGNASAVATERVFAHGKPQSLSLTLPPLSTLILSCEGAGHVCEPA